MAALNSTNERAPNTMSPLRLFALSLCVLGAAAASPDCTKPSLRITQPRNGETFQGVNGVTLAFEASCITVPSEAFVTVWDYVSDANDGGIQVRTMQPLTLHNVECGACTVGLSAPRSLFTVVFTSAGSQAFRLTLHPVNESHVVLDQAWVWFEVVPKGLPAVDPELARLTAARVQTRPLLVPPAPLRIVILADTDVFDGMKSFFIDYIKAFRRLGANITYLDTTCRVHGQVASTLGNEYTLEDEPTVVGRAVLAAGARLLRRCIICPSAVCASHHDFFDATGYTGPLLTAPTWSDLDPAWAAMLLPVASVLHEQDVMLVRRGALVTVASPSHSGDVCVCVSALIQLAWSDSFNADATHPGRLFLSHVAALASPGITRVVDLGMLHVAPAS